MVITRIVNKLIFPDWFSLRSKPAANTGVRLEKTVLKKDTELCATSRPNQLTPPTGFVLITQTAIPSFPPIQAKPKLASILKNTDNFIWVCGYLWECFSFNRLRALHTGTKQ